MVCRMGIDVRNATVDDADAIAVIHVSTWQHAYRGLLPSAYLDAIDVQRRADWWRRELTRTRDADPVFVASIDGELVGFASLGPQIIDDSPAEARGPSRVRPSEAYSRSSDAETVGELYAIYVDPGHWRAGAGTALLTATQSALGLRGYQQAILWVLNTNVLARSFYEKHGWAGDGAERTVELNGVSIPELRYRRAV
jgi:GNAT superfamily N-acetyltransferase